MFRTLIKPFTDKICPEVYIHWRSFFVPAILASCLLYLIVYVHRPLFLLPYAGYDDGLFINIGRSLAEGRWLGPYSQFTLMKGPGYPLFLAIGSWLGLSVSVMQALFHCAAVVLFSLMVEKISRSRLLAIAVFSVTLWHPAVFAMNRAIRDVIYPGQVLLILACFSYSLFVADQWGKRFLWGAMAGIILGWFWLTREEGVWILPGLGFLFLFAVVGTWHARPTLKKNLVSAAALLIVFAFTQFTFQVVNWMVYEDFVGVDIKEKNFKAAIAALQSVRVGEPVPYLPVSNVMRESIYSVSPAFYSLKDYFDPPGGSPWQTGCAIYPWTCGDIAGGWFMWALRDAAASRGHYQSPAQASAFYGTLTSEVMAACEDGRLECNEGLISYMPQLTRKQFEKIPGKILDAISLLSRTSMAPDYPSVGEPDIAAQVLAFLNYPVHLPFSNSNSLNPVFKFRGWYYEKGDAWISINIEAPDNTPSDISVKRYASPDLVNHFKDSLANNQRFTLKSACGKNCSFVISGKDGETLRVRIGDVVDNFPENHYFSFGNGALFFDSVEEVQAGRAVKTDYRARTSHAVRSVLVTGYRIAFPVLLGFGLLAFLGCIVMSWRKRNCHILVAFAATTWILTVTRIFILVLIDISSFPGINVQYLLPAFNLAAISAILSLAAFILMAGHLRRKPESNEKQQ